MYFNWNEFKIILITHILQSYVPIKSHNERFWHFHKYHSKTNAEDWSWQVEILIIIQCIFSFSNSSFLLCYLESWSWILVKFKKFQAEVSRVSRSFKSTEVSRGFYRDFLLKLHSVKQNPRTWFTLRSLNRSE